MRNNLWHIFSNQAWNDVTYFVMWQKGDTFDFEDSWNMTLNFTALFRLKSAKTDMCKGCVKQAWFLKLITKLNLQTDFKILWNPSLSHDIKRNLAMIESLLCSGLKNLWFISSSIDFMEIINILRFLNMSLEDESRSRLQKTYLYRDV